MLYLHIYIQQQLSATPEFSICLNIDVVKKKGKVYGMYTQALHHSWPTKKKVLVGQQRTYELVN